MADLYSILAKAVDALDPNTEETRRRLYERARVALVAETHRLAQSEAEFLGVLESLEDAIQRLEAEADAKAQRESPIQTPPAPASAAPPRRERLVRPPAEATSTALPRSETVAAKPRPTKPIPRQRLGQLIPLLAHALRLGRDGARNLLQRPARRRESLPDDRLNEMNFDPSPPDNWLSELLARASRPEHENGDGRRPPRRDARRNR